MNEILPCPAGAVKDVIHRTETMLPSASSP